MKAGVRAGCAVLALALVAVSTGPAAASAAFTPGNFVVEGKSLAGKRGSAVAVFANPQAVAVEGCRTRNARVRRIRSDVALRATVRCGKRLLTVVARVHGKEMRGTLMRRGKDRAFRARRAKRVGVLLRGKLSSRALRSVKDVDRLKRHRGSEVSVLGGERVARTEVVARFERTARVRQVNRLLLVSGGGIVGSLEGSLAVIAAIPDPGTTAALGRLVRRLARLPGVSSVTPSAMADEQELPPGIATPPTIGQRNAINHLVASGFPAAWNARSAIQAASGPTTVIADSFGDGPLSRHVDVSPRPRIAPPGALRGNSHGYQVASILFGDFTSDGTAAGLVTGAFPSRGKLVVIDKIDMTLPATGVRIVQTLDTLPSHVVLNTSQGINGGQADQDMFPEAADWIRDVKQRGLEQRVLHATSAGNDAQSARGNGLWAAAALRDDILDRLTGTRVGPLSNTLAVENVEERADLSGLACKFPTTNFDGNIAGPGTEIYSLDRDGRVAPSGNSIGTSFSTPVVAGLATYLWSIAPDLTPQQLKSALIDNGQRVEQSEQACVSAPRINAYEAVLSLDQAAAPSPSGYPVRGAILDLDGGGFTESDLATWVTKVDEVLPATERDWSRYDLNGDGFTGGTRGDQFDLNRSGSTRAGRRQLDLHVLASIEGHDREFDETSLLSDEDILCYYAYSPLYTGDPAQRATLLDRCAPCQDVTADFASDHSQANTDFLVKTVSFRYTSGRVLLARNCDGTRPLNIDDGIVVEVTRPNGSAAPAFDHDFSGGCSGVITDAGPFDLTSRFSPGNNTVKVRFRDLCAQGGSGTSRVVLVRAP